MTQAPVAIVAGASGFVGGALVDALVDDGFDVVRIGRTEDVTWDDPAAIARAVDGADVLVNRPASPSTAATPTATATRSSPPASTRRGRCVRPSPGPADRRASG